MLALWPLGSGIAAEVETLEEIVVRGHLPGPPLWKVSNGDKTLWIFPYLSWVPNGMIWESERVARVIAESQEVLSLPEWSWVPPLSVLLNPFSLVRNARRGTRAQRNPDGGTLEENLPPALYARFAALQARYFPGNDGLVEMRPLIAGRTMMSNIRKREGFVSGDDILKTIQRLVRRNRDIKRTEISVREEIGDGFGDWSNRLGGVWESFPPEQEQACFEQQVRLMEEDLDEMKNRANSWALGYIDEFRNDELRNVQLVFEESKACNDLWLGSSSPEHEALTGMITRVNQMWLGAAENALATNVSTFAILPINELVADRGLLSKLKAKGYDVREP
ncbi:MAG: TraB/GumN family protein [Steroidobacteraceae bacterium]